MERDEEVVWRNISQLQGRPTFEKKFVVLGSTMESPYMNIGNVSRNYVQAAPIIKLVSSYLSNISMRAFYPLIGA